MVGRTRQTQRSVHSNTIASSQRDTNLYYKLHFILTLHVTRPVATWNEFNIVQAFTKPYKKISTWILPTQMASNLINTIKFIWYYKLSMILLVSSNFNFEIYHLHCSPLIDDICHKVEIFWHFKGEVIPPFVIVVEANSRWCCVTGWTWPRRL